MNTSGAAVAVDCLQDHGVDTLFGLPGLQLDPLFSAFHDAGDRLRVVNARHEQGVAYMALGYAQATGRPGVYAAVPGPGFLNTTAALSTAYALHAPVLALIGQIPSEAIGAGFGELHELPDQSAILRGLTRWSGLARSADEVAPLMTEAFARLGRSGGPVGVELPVDVLRQEALAHPPAPVDQGLSAVDPDAVARGAALLGEARHPMIVVGGGALRAADAVKALAEHLGAPVLSHLTGRGVLDHAHPLAVLRDTAVRLWAETDVVVAVGTRFNTPRRRWGLRPGQRVIRLDRDAAQLRRGSPAEVDIAADAVAALPALLAALRRHRPVPTSPRESIAREKRATLARFEAELGPQMAYLGAMQAALPPDSVLVTDYTQVGYVATAAWPVSTPRQLLTPGYQGTLGWAFATALGAKVGRPDVPVVAVVGDGGFLFTANELATAVMHRIPSITVLFNDGHYGNVRRMQEQLYGGRVVASGLHNPDFVRFAESFGAAARRVSEPAGLTEALQWALGQGGPTVIEVSVGAMPSPWHLLEPDGPPGHP